MADPARHLAVPVRLGPDGDFVTVAQGSAAEVTQNVHTAARTELGSRTGRPTFGVPDTTFQAVDPAELARLLTEAEPRAQVTIDAELIVRDQLQAIRVDTAPIPAVDA